MKKLRGYVSSREFMGEICHQSTQNLVIRDYCERNNYKYLLSGTEYSIKNSYLMLNEVLREIPSIDGIVAYSLFQLPEERNERKCVFDSIVQKNSQIHFALENFSVSNISEIIRAEHIWLIRQTLQNCITSIK